MNFPFTIHTAWGDVTVHAICETLAVFVAFRYFVWLRKKKGDRISENNRLGVIVGAMLGAVLGARLIGAAEDIPAWLQAANGWTYFFHNKTMLGGLLGGLVGVELVKKIAGERQNTGDLFVFPMIVGICIGRIGCFSAGVHEETYGLASTLPWAMDLGDGILRHPVALYEIVFLLALALVLKNVRKRYPLQQGALFKLFMISYLCFRLALDIIKPGWRYFAGMGTIQLASIAGLLYYARYIIRPRLLLQTT